MYPHGSGEHPFDFGSSHRLRRGSTRGHGAVSRWFSSNSVRRLHIGHQAETPANVVAVRAPFHDRSSDEYPLAMGDLENFVGMLVASAGLLKAIATRATERTDASVVASGISPGNWAINHHCACFDAVDRYVPIFAGAALTELFVSSIYRKLAAESDCRRP